MLFNSIEFLFFLPLVFFTYWLVGKRQWQNLLLVVFSYIFYGRGYRIILSKKLINIINKDGLGCLYLEKCDDWIIGNILNSYWIRKGKNYLDYIKGLDYNYFIDDFIPNKQVVKNAEINVDEKERYKHGNIINYKYLRMIIELCKEHKCSLYLVYSPHYKPEEYYDVDYYYESYHRYFSDVPLLDYSHFQIEEGEWCDASHLNEKGAIRFTREIK